MHTESNNIVSALAFKFIESIAVKALGFIISVILARLIAPEIFGITSIVIAVVTIVQTFITSGLNTALIQNKSTTESDYSTVFYISTAIAVFMYAALFFLSPVITAYYSISEYLLHFRVLSLVILAYSINSVQTAKLTREMQFRKMMFCQIITCIISGGVGLTAAFAGLGIWALIIYYMTSSAVLCITYGYASKWHPELTFSVVRAKELFNYGYKLLLSGLIYSLCANIKTFIIGKLYTKTELGLYTRGEQIPTILSGTIGAAFSSVMLPVFSQEQDKRDAIHKRLRKTIAINSYINFPAMLGLTVVAPSVVILLYTQKWEACIPYLQLMCLANLSPSITSPCSTAIVASGHSETSLKLQLVLKLIMLVVLGISLLFRSLTAIAIGWVITTIINTCVIIISTRKLVGYTFRDLFFDVGPILLISLAMSGTVWLVGMFELPMLLELTAQLVCGVLIYIGLSYVFKIESFLSLKEVALSVLSQIRTLIKK